MDKNNKVAKPGIKLEQARGFVNRNLVLIVMIPMLVSIHWGWWTLQKNPNLVDQSSKRNPFDIAMRQIKKRWGNEEADEKDM